MKQNKFTDKWGVTYSDGGRVLSDIDSDKFLCEEYTIPEGVERIEYAFMMIETKNLRKIHLPSTLRYMCDNTFIDCPIEEIELPEGMTVVAGCMCENCVYGLCSRCQWKQTMKLNNIKRQSKAESASKAVVKGKADAKDKKTITKKKQKINKNIKK